MSSSDPVDSRLREALEINPEALDSFVSRLEERIVSGATSSPMDEAPAAKSHLGTWSAVIAGACLAIALGLSLNQGAQEASPSPATPAPSSPTPSSPAPSPAASRPAPLRLPLTPSATSRGSLSFETADVLELIDASDAIVIGRVVALSDQTVEFLVSETLRGDLTGTALTLPRQADSSGCLSFPVDAWKGHEGSLCLLLTRDPATGWALVDGEQGVQSLPADSVWTLADLRLLARGAQLPSARVVELVRDHGPKLLSRFDSVLSYPDQRTTPSRVIGQAGLGATLVEFLEQWAHAAKQPGISEVQAALAHLRPEEFALVSAKVKSWLRKAAPTYSLPLFAAIKDPAAEVTVRAHLARQESLERVDAQAETRLLRLLRAYAPQEALSRARALYARPEAHEWDGARDQTPTLSALLEWDPAGAQRELLGRVRRALLVSSPDAILEADLPNAPPEFDLLLECSGPEAAELVRSVLAKGEVSRYDSDRFSSRLTRLQPARRNAWRALLAPVLQERMRAVGPFLTSKAEEQNDEDAEDDAEWAREEFTRLLGVYVALGGERAPFLGPKLRALAEAWAASSVDDDQEDVIDLGLLRLLEEWLGRKALSWRSPTPAESAAALRVLALAAETP